MPFAWRIQREQVTNALLQALQPKLLRLEKCPAKGGVGKLSGG